MFKKILNFFSIHFIWTMRWSILSIFFLMIGISSLTIIFFAYNKNNQTIFSLAQTRMQIVSNEIENVIDGVTNQAVLFAEVTRGLITQEAQVSEENQKLTSYILNAMDSIQLFNRVRIGTKNGNLVEVINLSNIQESSNAPPGTKYIVRFINSGGNSPTETVQYLDTNSTIIETSLVSGSPPNPTAEDWYRQAATWPHLHWTSVFLSLVNHMGVYTSLPLIDESLEIYGVIAVDLSLEQLSNIISYQSIGKTGKTFIYNPRGELLSPLTPPSESFLQLLRQSRDQWETTQQPNFILKQNKVKYLVNYSILPLTYEERWVLITIVPFNDFFEKSEEAARETLIVSFGILLFFSILVYFISKMIAKPLAKLALRARQIQHLDLQEHENVVSHISEIVTLSHAFRSMHHALSSFIRYAPKEIIKTLLEQGKQIEVGGEKKNLVVLFSDIEDFTTTAEKLPIDTLFSYLSGYFECLSKIYVQHEGTIDKYIGDSVMVLWNAPQPVTNPAIKACLAALCCLKIDPLQKAQNPFLKGHTRFGIHSGEVIVGNVGTSERMSYTAIGNVVNTAARLQNLNKEYHTYIMISESVHEEIGMQFITRPLDFVVVKGRAKGITIYELVGTTEGELAASPEEIALCQEFNQAYKQFHEGKMEESFKSFLELQKRFPNDFPIKLYLNRILAISRKS